LVFLLLAWQIYVAGFDATADGGTLVRFGARRPNFGFPQPTWRLLCSTFLHGGWIHLLSNALLIIFWGGKLCRLLGNVAFLGVFLVAGFWGSLISDIYGPEAIAIGASGGTSGLLLAVLTMALLNPSRERWDGEAGSWLRSSLAVVALNLVFVSGLTGGSHLQLDHWAHTGGAIAGAFLGSMACLDREGRNRALWFGVLSLVLAAVGVVSARGSSPLG